MSGTLTRPNLFQRLRAVLSPSLTHPAMLQSYRMPDIERWHMPHRTVDMADWEVALNMAKNLYRPDRTRLMDLYDSILKDAHLGSLIETRELHVQGAKYKLVDKQGVSKPEHARLLEAPWFLDFIKYTVGARFEGHTLIELGELVRPGQLRQVNKIDPRNVLPYAGVVAKRQGEETGYLFREAPLNAYLIEVGRPEDLGLLERVAPVAVVKKYAVGSWSAFTGSYGIPARWVKTRGNDARRMKQLEMVMQNMLSSAYAVLQGDEEFGIAPTPTTSPDALFDKLISRMNSEMSKRLLGQDGTTDNKDASGTYGSMKVLEGVADDRHKSDKTFVAHVINEQLLPRLIALGYPFAGLRFAWDEFRDMSASELVDAVAKLATHYDIDPKHIEERTGIRILGARRMPGEVAGNPPGMGKQSGKKKGESEEETTEEAEDEDGITAQWPRDTLGPCGICGGSRGIIAAATPGIGSEAIMQLLQDTHDGATWSQPYFEAVRDVYSEGLLNTWRTSMATLHYDAPDHAARMAMEMNLAQFSSAKTLSVALELNGMVRDSKGFADFKAKVDASGILDKYNTRWLATEYQTAVNTGLQASRWYDLQRNADAVPFAEYWTAGDAQVRPPHAVLDGKRWPVNDPILNTIAPPNGYGCRCTLVGSVDGPQGAALDQQRSETMDALSISGELGRMKKTGFAMNRAVTGEVFKLNKAYKDTLSGASGNTPTLGIRDSYGTNAASKSWQALSQGPLPAISSNTTSELDAQRWFSRNANDKGVVVMTDHAGRPVQFEAQTLDKKLRKEPGRAELVDQLPGVLNQPDEVWLDSRGDMVYLKFTSQGVLRVPVIVESGSAVRLRTFYLDAWDENADKQRAGLLLKRHQ